MPSRARDAGVSRVNVPSGYIKPADRDYPEPGQDHSSVGKWLMTLLRVILAAVAVAALVSGVLIVTGVLHPEEIRQAAAGAFTPPKSSQQRGATTGGVPAVVWAIPVALVAVVAVVGGAKLHGFMSRPKNKGPKAAGPDEQKQEEEEEAEEEPAAEAAGPTVPAEAAEGKGEEEEALTFAAIEAEARQAVKVAMGQNVARRVIPWRVDPLQHPTVAETELVRRVAMPYLELARQLQAQMGGAAALPKFFKRLEQLEENFGVRKGTSTSLGGWAAALERTFALVRGTAEPGPDEAREKLVALMARVRRELAEKDDDGDAAERDAYVGTREGSKSFIAGLKDFVRDTTGRPGEPGEFDTAMTTLDKLQEWRGIAAVPDGKDKDTTAAREAFEKLFDDLLAVRENVLWARHAVQEAFK